MSRAFLLSGAQGLLSSWRRPARGGVSVNALAVDGVPPWSIAAPTPIAVVTAILQSASGGGVRTALSTAAVETCATLYASALSSCARSRGPSSVTRALDSRPGGRLCRVGLGAATAKRSSSLTRTRRRAWRLRRSVIGTRTAGRSGRAGSIAANWLGRRQPPGARGALAAVLHLRWIVDRGAAVGGCQSAPTRKRYRDASGVDRQAPRRRGERAGRRVSAGRAIRTSRRWTADDPDTDPLAQLRMDIGGAKGQTLLVESQMASADSPASAPRKDFQVARFGANPPRDLVELRQQITRDIGAAMRRPARVTRQHGIRDKRQSGSLEAICLDIG